MANQFLVKETMATMRGLSAAEITALQNGTYNGVQLLGYYEKGDTPAPVIYYISSTSAMDDGGSTIVINGLVFTHQFSGAIDVRYFGCKCDGIQDGSIFLQRAIDYVAPYNWLGSVPLTKDNNTTLRGYLVGTGKIRVTRTIYINPYLTIEGKTKGSWFAAQGGLEIIGDFDGKEKFIFDTAPYNTGGVRVTNYIGSADEYDNSLLTPVVGWTLSGIKISAASNRNIKGAINRTMATNSEIKNCRIRGANIGIQSSVCWGGTINRNLILARAVGLSNRGGVTEDQQWDNYISMDGLKPTLTEFDYPNYDGNVNQGSTCCVYSWGSLASHYNNIWEKGEIGFMVMGESSHKLSNNYAEGISKYVFCSQAADLDITLGPTVYCGEASLIYCTANKVKIDFGNISTFSVKSLGFRYASQLSIKGVYRMFPKLGYSLDFETDVYFEDLGKNGLIDIYVDPQGSDDNWGYHNEKPIRTLQEALARCKPGYRNVIHKTGAGQAGDTKFTFRDGYNTIDKQLDLDNVTITGGEFRVGKVADLAVHNISRGIQHLRLANTSFIMDNVTVPETSFLISVRGIQQLDLQEVKIKGGVLFGAKSNDGGFANIMLESCILDGVKLQQQGVNGRLKWIETSRNTINTAGSLGSTTSTKISSDLYLG